MKNFKMNERLKNRIISSGLSLVLFTSGFALGKLNSKIDSSAFTKIYQESISKNDELVDEYLDEYIKKRSTLEKEINDLYEQIDHLKNSRTFNIKKLMVIECTDINGQNNLYILECQNGIYDSCREYHHLFRAIYCSKGNNCVPEKNHESIDTVYFHEGKLLLYYLTSEEEKNISQNSGKITISELDTILNRIRTEYQEQSLEDDHSKRLKKSNQ